MATSGKSTGVSYRTQKAINDLDTNYGMDTPSPTSVVDTGQTAFTGGGRRAPLSAAALARQKALAEALERENRKQMAR
jgi:hypothetical protein